MPVKFKNDLKQIFATYLTKTIPAIFLSFTLFAGGIVVLFLRIPGWSLFLGLPAVTIGTTFLIFTFDDITRRVITPPSFKPTKCNVCGKITYVEEDQKDVICGSCREDILEEVFTKEDFIK